MVYTSDMSTDYMRNSYVISYHRDAVPLCDVADIHALKCCCQKCFSFLCTFNYLWLSFRNTTCGHYTCNFRFGGNGVPGTLHFVPYDNTLVAGERIIFFSDYNTTIQSKFYYKIHCKAMTQYLLTSVCKHVRIAKRI